MSSDESKCENMFVTCQRCFTRLKLKSRWDETYWPRPLPASLWMWLAWSQPLSAWLAHWLADMCDWLSFIFLSYSLIEMFCVMCSMTLIKHLDVLHLLCFFNHSHITSAPLSMSDINVQQFGVINTLSAADDVEFLREENILPSVDCLLNQLIKKSVTVFISCKQSCYCCKFSLSCSAMRVARQVSRRACR